MPNPDLSASLGEVARFLARHPPFDALAPEDLGELVTGTELEFHLAGERILTEDGGPVTFLRVIHSGAVDLVHGERLLDLLGPGETFGQAAMLSGLEPGFEARAAEDTLCYRIPVAVARPLLERAKSRDLAVGPGGPGHQAVAELIRAPTVLCQPDETIAAVAKRMTAAGASAAIVELEAAGVGILTDRDLRVRVLAVGRPYDTPVREVMSAPAFTVDADRIGGEVLFELLERGIHHAPIVVGDGRVVGVVEDADLFAVQPRSWFGARRAIARATDAPSLMNAAAQLPRIVSELHSSNQRPFEIARVLCALYDALVARSFELAAEASEPTADGTVWLALGPHARRELAPGSPPIGVLLCSDPPAPAFLQTATELLRACGLAAPAVCRSPVARFATGFDEALTLSVLFDRRPLFGTPREPLPAVPGAEAKALVESLRARALQFVTPTGFDGVSVIGHDGARAATLDIRRAAIEPIFAIALWAGAAAGRSDGSTAERLQAAADAGIISAGDAGTLGDAYELAFELHIERRVAALGREVAPGPGTALDDAIDPRTLSPLARDHLRDVFRAVAAVQRRLCG